MARDDWVISLLLFSLSLLEFQLTTVFDNMMDGIPGHRGVSELKLGNMICRRPIVWISRSTLRGGYESLNCLLEPATVVRRE